MDRVIRTDVWFEVAGKAPLPWHNSRIQPLQAQVIHERGEVLSVLDSGTVVRTDGSLGLRTGKALYGRFGTPLVHAPQWIHDLAARVIAMEGRDA